MKPIAILRRAGGLGRAASVPAGTYSTVTSAPATASITFKSDGTWAVVSDTSPTGTWLTGTGTGANYWMRWTTTSGTLTSGTTGTWLVLSSNRAYTKTDSVAGGGALTVTGTVEISSDSSGTTILSTGSITLSALAV